MTRRFTLLLSPLLLSFATSATVEAQCAQFAAGGSLPGVSGSILALRKWDPDGAGPLPPVTIVAGGFAVAGNVAAANIAAYDPATGSWSPLGSGVNGPVSALEELTTGELVAGGVFTTAGGVTVNGIAKWDGSTWSAFGSGVATDFPPAIVNALAVLNNGDLVAAGDFDSAGGVPTRRIARWNGATWAPVNLGANAPIQSLLKLSNGDLLAGGPFTTIGAVAANYIARFDGTSWSPLGAGAGSTVYCMFEKANGDIYAGGASSTGGGAIPVNCIVRWNGTQWSQLGTAPLPPHGTTVFHIDEMPNGDLIVGGTFATMGGTAANDLARWDGSNWSAVGSTFTGTVEQSWSHGVRSFQVEPNGDLLVGGWFASAGTTTANGIARWNGTQWFSVASGTNATVNCFAQKPNGNVIAGGTFAEIGGTAANRIAEWDGSQWSPLGSGIDGQVFAVAALPNGDVVAGGKFTTAGSTPAANIARWDGTSWTPLASGLTAVFSTSAVNALLAMPNGDVIAGGSFNDAGGVSVHNVARWDGSTWSAMYGMVGTSVNALTLLPGGDIVAGGQMNIPFYGVARWNGTAWSAMGFSGGLVTAFTFLPNGDLVAAGSFAAPGTCVARWNGSAWSPLGSGVNAIAYAVATMPDGDVVIGGGFLTAGGQPATRIARWNGSAWSPLGSGTNAQVKALLVDARGELFVGGTFTTADGIAAPFSARYQSTCIATATASGTGCNGQQLVATSLPWVDATMHARGTGLPTDAIVVAVTSFASIPQGMAPLASFFGGLSPAGCDLLVGPDIVQTIVTTNGIADSELFLPNTPPLVGLPFFHQMVPVELDPSLNVLSVTATNSLRLVAGDF